MATPSLLILSSARSYSSVVTATLGCHSQMFALPEQNLSVAETLGELLEWEKTLGSDKGYVDGLKRAVAVLECGGQGPAALQEAEGWIRRRCFWRTEDMFCWLRDRVAPHILVYKSPRATLARRSMFRLLSMAPQGKYLHLVREPATTVASWMTSVGDTGITARRFFAELWVQSQRLILEAEESLKPGQVMRVRGEDFLTQPSISLRRIAQWIPADDGDAEIQHMLHPEKWPFASSLPGIFDNDPDFLREPRLRPAFVPHLKVEELGLGQQLTREMANLREVFGYSF